MKLAFVSLLTVLALLLEPLAASLSGGATLRPSGLLIPIVVAVIACPGPPAVIVGGLVGLVCDCLAGQAMGPRLAAFALIAAVASLAARPKSVFGMFLLSAACMGGLEMSLAGVRLAESGHSFLEMPRAIEIAGPALLTALVISGIWLAASQLIKPFAGRRRDGGWPASIG